MASFIIMVIIPFFFGIYYSLTDWNGIGDPNYVGLLNYQNISSDPKFYYSFYRTALYSTLNIFVINVVAFSLASLVTQKLRGVNIYRAGFFMPNLIGGLVLGYIFQFIYSQAFLSFGDTQAIMWLSDLVGRDFFNKNMLTSGASNSMIALIIVVTWQYAGYIMMIYIAAIQNIPQQLVEAAKIDGANALQRLRHITLPLVAQAFTVAMFLTLVTSFKQFDTVFSMTQGGPVAQLPQFFGSIFGLTSLPPVKSLDLMAVNIYNTAFAKSLFGYGQAKAIIFFIILLIISLLQVYYNKKREVEL
ncbi:MAG: sugar ABC transporter permease [Candidatus Izimaplasma sp.]|nr:sugar ABC transporter permease [Candidatus Izimaplasma bacterium]